MKTMTSEGEMAGETPSADLPLMPELRRGHGGGQTRSQ